MFEFDFDDLEDVAVVTASYGWPVIATLISADKEEPASGAKHAGTEPVSLHLRRTITDVDFASAV